MSEKPVSYENIIVRDGTAILYEHFPDAKRGGRDHLDDSNFNIHVHGFSSSAQKRLLQAADNMASMMISIHHINKGLLKFQPSWQPDKTYYRKPVFLTLTVPKQTSYQGKFTPPAHIIEKYCTKRLNYSLLEFYTDVNQVLELSENTSVISHKWEKDKSLTVNIGLDDRYIKRHVFQPFINNLQNYGLRCYIWKAEAQLRGDIHFHIVTDLFLYHAHVRKLWFEALQRHDLLKEGQLLKESSRLVWFEQVEDLSAIRHELAGYFASNMDKWGNTIYKHNRRKRVRAIAGNTWGCSDTLRYDPFVLEMVDNDTIKKFDGAALKRVDIIQLQNPFAISKNKGKKSIALKPDDDRYQYFVDNGRIMATVWVTKHTEREKKSGQRPIYTTEYAQLDEIRKQHIQYHYEKALSVYN